MPLVSRTRATLRSAEFGFLGVFVYTRVHTPRRWGAPLRAAVFPCRACPRGPCGRAAEWWARRSRWGGTTAAGHRTGGGCPGQPGRRGYRRRVRLTEVHVPVFALERFLPLIGDELGGQLMETAETARELLEGKVVWNINTTATGGGVAEMLQTLLGYSRGAGVDARWVVMAGDPEFFRMTKRMHNFFHGSPGDGGQLDAAERAHFEEISNANGQELAAMVRPGDVVLVHDPQPAGLVPILKSIGASVVWRSHIGIDVSNEWTDSAWSFVRPYVEQADVCVFSRQEYVPDWLERPVRIIAPSIDPFAVKNADMSDEAVQAILTHVGLIQGDLGAVPSFTRL